MRYGILTSKRIRLRRLLLFQTPSSHHYQYTVSDRFSGSVFSAYSRNLTLHELYSLPTLSNRMRAASRSVAGTPPSRPRSLWVLVQAHRHLILYGIPGNGLLYYSGQSLP